MDFQYTKQTFETRKELFAQAQKQMGELDAQIAATETGAAAAKETVAEAEHLRSERKSLFARLLSIGKTDFENSEVKELDAAIAAKRDQADRAADILAAQSELLERLYAERLELANRIEELRRLLLGSQYEMFIAEIEHEHIPEYLKAAEAFAQAAAKLAGYGKAAAMMRDKLIENGIRATAPAYGQHIPARAVDLRIDGFNLQQREDGSHNGVFDVSGQVEQYCKEAMKNAQ